MCLRVKGLEFKKSWEVWAQTPQNFSHPFFKVRLPEEGLVVMGGLVHSAECTEVEVLMGTDTFISKHVSSLISKIKIVADKFENVISLAAPASHAERICFKVFSSTMQQKSTYFLPTFPPDVSTGVAAKLDDIFRSTTAKILGPSKEEAIEIAPQTELHPDDGGHGANSSEELAPLLHLASWLSTTHEHSPKSSEKFPVIPITQFFAGEFSERMKHLFLVSATNLVQKV